MKNVIHPCYLSTLAHLSEHGSSVHGGDGSRNCCFILILHEAVWGHSGLDTMIWDHHTKMIHFCFIPRLLPVPGNEAWHFSHIILHSRILAGHIQTFSLQMYLINKYLSLEEASVVQMTWASYTVCTSWSNTLALRMHKYSSLKMLRTCNT